MCTKFFYTQLPFGFVPQEDSYYVHDHTEAFIFFFFSKFFLSFSSGFLPFFSFSDNTLDLEKNNYEKYFIRFFICFKNYLGYMSILWIT